jgi:hypothetical protein
LDIHLFVLYVLERTFLFGEEVIEAHRTICWKSDISRYQ